LRERYAERAPAAVLAAVEAAAPHWGNVLERCAEGPQTLVHNDCRLDNLFFDDDGEPVFVDWQIVARTRGVQDVANLLAGNMDGQDLRDHWEPLLRRYHDRLCAQGIRGYGWEDCLAHYRQSVLYPLGAGLALLGAMDIGDGRGLGDAIVRRALGHVAELDSFGAL
ncbi:MAG: phosphotransferase, partial [Candidatus Binatia bacterium]